MWRHREKMAVYVAGGRLEHAVPHSLRRGQPCPHLHLRLSAPGLRGFDSPRLLLWGEQTRHHPLGSPSSLHSQTRGRIVSQGQWSRRGSQGTRKPSGQEGGGGDAPAASSVWEPGGALGRGRPVQGRERDRDCPPSMMPLTVAEEGADANSEAPRGHLAE